MQDSMQAACICKNMADRTSVDGASMDDTLNRNRMELRCLHAKPWFTRSLLRQPYPDNPDLVVRLSKFLEFCFSLCPELLWLSGPVVFTAIPSLWSEVTNQTFISAPWVLNLVGLLELGTSTHSDNHLLQHAPGALSVLKAGLFSVVASGFCGISVFPSFLESVPDYEPCCMWKALCWRRCERECKIMSEKTNRKCHTHGLLIWILTKDEGDLILYFIPEPFSRLRTNCRLLLRRQLMVLVEGPITSSANYCQVFSLFFFGSRLLWTAALICQLSPFTERKSPVKLYSKYSRFLNVGNTVLSLKNFMSFLGLTLK